MDTRTWRIAGGLWAKARKILHVTAAVMGVLLLCLPVFSQANYGRILGRVTDQTGGVIAGAPVTITNAGTGVARNLTTDEAGEYNAPGLIPGKYVVRVSASGFKSVDRQDILLEIGKEIRIDIQLTPGEVSQTVEVSGAAPMVDTTSVTLGGTLSNDTINDLPLNGRNYINLLSLRPGVEQYPGGGAWTQSGNGLRVEDVNFVIDGMDNNESFQGEAVIDSPGTAGDSATILPIDAIQEFNVLENPKAEFGWKAGAVVNVGLKSGTNQLHGTAYGFGRTDALDAKNYFAPGPKPPLNFEQWGGTAGGPIVKDKLFYFAGFEEQRYVVGNSSPITIPTTASGGGAAVSIPDAQAALNAYCGSPQGIAAAPPFCSGGTPNVFVQNDLSTKLLPLFGSTNAPDGNVVTNFNATNKSDNVLAKIDYTITAHHTLSGSYFLGNDNNVSQDIPVTQPQFLSTFKIRAMHAAGHWVWTPNSRWVNEAQFGFVRYTRPVHPVDYTVNPMTYGINTGVTDPVSFGMPTILVTALGEIGAFPVWPTNVGPNNNFDFLDQVSYLRGKHAFRFGAEIRYARMRQEGRAFSRGDFEFTGTNAICIPGPPTCSTQASTPLEDFLAGTPNDAFSTVGNPVRNYRNKAYAGFVQDDWRVKPNVTLNLGLRYEYSAPLTEANNLLGNFIPGSQYGMLQVGNGISSPYNRQKTNFAPRLGVAWDISGNGTTVIRAGGGIFYEALQAAVFTGQGIALQNNPGGGGVGNIPTGAQLVTCSAACQAGGSATTVTIPGGTIDTASKYSPGFLLNWTAAGPVLPSGGHKCGDGNQPAFGPPDPFPCSIVAVAQNFRTPYVAMWTLTLQHAFSPGLSLEIGYVGNHGDRLSGVVDLNQIDPNSPAELACGHCESSANRPFGAQYPYLRFIDQVQNPYRSNYHGLQATFTGRNYHGLSFVAGYTYSHALDDLSFSAYNFTPQDNNNIAAQYGNSDFDIRHRFTLTTTYDIPGKKGWGQLLEGWELNSIATLSGRQPWAAFDTKDDISKTGELMDRWDFFGNPSDFNSGPTPLPYFSGTTNPACVAAEGNVANGPGGATGVQSLSSFGCYAKGKSVLVPPAIGTFGTMARNVFRDSGYRNWDLSVFKMFRFRERLTAQFRAEFFNVLNHPNFANPYSSINLTGIGTNADPSSNLPGANAFGCGCRTPDQAATDPVLGSGSARDIQLGLKLIF